MNKTTTTTHIMKHNTILLSLMAMLCLFFSSCDDETGKNLLKLNKEKITLNHEKATEKITVTAGAAWQVSGVPEWMHVTPSESEEMNQEIVIELRSSDFGLRACYTKGCARP